MRIVRYLFFVNIMFLINVPAVIVSEKMNLLLKVVVVYGACWFLVFQVLPVYKKGLSVRTQVLRGGYELLWTGAAALVAEIPVLICLWKWETLADDRLVTVSASIILLFLLAGICVYNGVFRMLLASKQLKLPWKLLLLFTMWIPLWNFLLVWKDCRTVRKEYMVESELEQRNNVRVESQICKTQYPIVMVHGIFFRDWQLMNYWGRVPYELMKNGASVYYGNQQSALKVEESAKEVKKYILEVIAKTGAKKVNIIAHSKGGLDVRYAISRLEMEPFVRSLTTINTPHKGCKWVENILEKMPDKLIHWVARKYNRIFAILGDKQPDFLCAVKDLTVKRSVELNQQMPDAESVYYQSVMSVMKKRSSAGFPLNMVYSIVKKTEGENDGLVGVGSAPFGNFLGVLRSTGRRGISHGDMIDLMRENIPGFDVREFYVGLVSGLKQKGF